MNSASNCKLLKPQAFRLFLVPFDREHCWLSRRSRQGNRWIVQALGIQALAIQADSAMIDGGFSA
ncbi:MAG: hypothetical protein HWQ41_05460 [Nostoc sp. NOS(2021)]|uniref:hypothetical protein n=1 Tax=Nostoc sp. NOS(2021) TaxID=2815407 RepID=UPI0025FEC262|nr:hypothetical protein [Nostoc sp. NOS(2021)]MBN3894718.1 hypothetical protein [Nostoc sp. NOS(2021)]